ncbi:hypothetical protein Pint_14235 [Pistacia integerrima]|uniref:Uncharacterized protein n=1 Tax=Pistacia integerrima TaxID=434235 RepID=A0ACC0YBT6_9ROSI|nr:hypothetical protein Pint_14235 [Pistacia integerrima]
MVRSRFLLLFLPSFLLSIHVVGIHSGAAEINVPIGAVLDLDSAEGATAEVSISMAIADFYATHSDYQTRLIVHTRNSKDLVDTASAGTSTCKYIT